MKRTVFFVLGALAVSIIAVAQPTQPTEDPNDVALSPAPRQLREGATVIKWKPDHTYDTLKKGTNRLVCYERPVAPGVQQAFSAECTSIANLERVAASLKIEASAPDQKARQVAFEAAEKAGQWPKPEFGSIFYNMTGASAESGPSTSTRLGPNTAYASSGTIVA